MSCGCRCFGILNTSLQEYACALYRSKYLFVRGRGCNWFKMVGTALQSAQEPCRMRQRQGTGFALTMLPRRTVAVAPVLL